MTCIIHFPSHGQAQGHSEFDEISIYTSVPLLGGAEIPALVKGDSLLLSLSDLFEFLRINHRLHTGLDSISGYLQNSNDTYCIDITRLTVYRGQYVYRLHHRDMVLRDNTLYLLSGQFDALFGLECAFNPRKLTAAITPKWELAATKELKREKERYRLLHTIKPFIADTTLKRSFRIFHPGVATWEINTRHYSNTSSFIRLKFGLGAVLAGGELKTTFNYTLGRPLLDRQQYYQWRYVNNNNKVVRQIRIGKLPVSSISTIFSQVAGIQLTNTPSYRRTAFGQYAFNASIPPDHDAELYINNRLTDLVQSDSSGKIQHDLPLLYGRNEFKIRYTDSWGQDHTLARHFNISRSLLPVNELEYTLSAGLVQDGAGNTFSQGRMQYGLTGFLTIGGGIEYFSAFRQTASGLYFVNASTRIFENTFIKFEYVPDVRHRINFMYQPSSRITLEMDYTQYNALQEAVRYNYSEERRIRMRVPFRLLKIRGNTRLEYHQYTSGSQHFHRAEWYFMLSSRKFSLSAQQNAFFRNAVRPNIFSNLELSLQLPTGFRLRTRTIYNYTDHRLITLNIDLEKRLSTQGHFHVGIESRFDRPARYMRAGFRYDFSVFRMNTAINASQTSSVITSTLSGNIIYDNDPSFIEFSRHSNLGRGGIAFSAFLDLNGNQLRDSNEPLLERPQVTQVGGGGRRVLKDSLVTYLGLEPFRYFDFKVDEKSLGYIAWKIVKPSMRIMAEPNHIRHIEIPVIPVGEIFGNIQKPGGKGANGNGSVRLTIYNHNGQMVTTFLADQHGDFNYLGLLPGEYTIAPDAAQLERLRWKSQPDRIAFEINPDPEGDIISGLDFILETITRD